MSGVTKTSADHVKSLGFAYILKHKFQAKACMLSQCLLIYLRTHLFLPPPASLRIHTHTHAHTVTLWALLGSLNEKEKSFIRLIFAAPRSTF